jgi:polygalacturonase
MFYNVALNQKTTNIFKEGLEVKDMSHKSLALGAFLVVASIIVVGTFLATTSILQAINPVAALTALTVALIGFAWFKKTNC